MNSKKTTSLNLLLALSFLMQMLSGVVGIAVPIYAAEMNASAFLIGVIGSVGGLIYSFTPFISGMFTDRFGRKTFIIISTFLYGLSCMLYALAGNPYMLMLIKALEWFSIATFWPSIEALLADISGSKIEENLKKFNLSWVSGLIIGPMIGGLLISVIGVEAPFIMSSAASLTLAILAIIMLSESLKDGAGRMREESKISESDVSATGAVTSIILFSFIVGIILNLFPAQAKSLEIPAYEIGLIMLINGVFRLIAFLEAYRIETAIGESITFLLGSLILALASALASVSHTTPMFSISFSALGFGAGILYAASISFILKRWNAARGYGAGLFESLIGTGYFIGPLIGGFISEYAQNAPYILSLFLSISASVIHALNIKKKQV
jgi:MFS family permease